MKDKFLLDSNITFLNHGSFGACPIPIVQDYRDWQEKLENQPVYFMSEILFDALRKSRISLGEFVGCDEDEIVFFPNPTTAVTNVIYNLDLQPGDEVLMSNHEYGALVRAWTEWGKKSGVSIIQQEIPIPVTTPDEFVDCFWQGVTSKTKVIFLSHITSSTALIFPVEKIVSMAGEMGILTIVDGAHVPAHIQLNIRRLGCDFYTGACHKWLCGPKGSSFLYVKKEHQAWIKPVVYSWGKEGADPGPSEFLQDFQWQGTRDMSAYLTVPIAIEFYQNEIKKRQSQCRQLVRYAAKEFENILRTDPIFLDDDWIGQMVSYPLPALCPDNLKENLWNDFQIEIPVFQWEDMQFIRISIQVYNSKKDIEHLMSALDSLI